MTLKPNRQLDLDFMEYCKKLRILTYNRCKTPNCSKMDLAIDNIPVTSNGTCRFNTFL